MNSLGIPSEAWERAVEAIRAYCASVPEADDGLRRWTSEGILEAAVRSLLESGAVVNGEVAALSAARLVREANERALRAERALAHLVRLKDGPRDEAYERDKPGAWQAAREVLARLESEAGE